MSCRNRRFAGVLAAGALALGTLSACGGDDSTVSTSPTGAATPSSAAVTPGSPTGALTNAPSTAGAPQTPEPVPGDYPGPTTVPRTNADRTFLRALGDAGVRTRDVEDQLIGADNDICRARAEGRDPAIVANAAAGQLVGQGMSGGDPAALARRLVDESVRAYCP